MHSIGTVLTIGKFFVCFCLNCVFHPTREYFTHMETNECSALMTIEQ